MLCQGAAAQWFMYQDEWHLCHLCHLCWLCHHDMEGGGGIGKCAATHVVTWVSSLVTHVQLASYTLDYPRP